MGRGLDALIPIPEPAAPPGELGQRVASLDAIDPNPDQPRSGFDDEALGELADSIRQLGILQPLLVRPVGERLRLIAGERRLRAARLAGLDEVPVMVVETDDRGALERALVENIHREDLNPIEEAAAYKQLLEDAGLTHEALAERLGRNRVTISNSLRLLDLPPTIQRYLIDGALSAGHGRALLGLQRSPFQERLAARVRSDGSSVRETEELVRRYQEITGATGGGGGTTGSRPPEIAEAQRRLADLLQTRVRVELGKRKGKIVIDFATLDELDRLLGIVAGAPGPAATRVTPS